MKMTLKTAMNSLAFGLLLGLAGTGTGVAQDKIEEAPLVGGLKDLKTLNRQLVEMAEGSSAATVSLVSKGGGGAGSGVIVSEDGLILTAAHVLAAMSDEIIVIFPDGTRKPAVPLGADFDRDAAMVRITEEGSYPFAELGESDGLRRNEWCVALGHPGGFDPNRTPPVRLGRVLRVGGFVVTDCAVVGGDSGGPLFDVEGRVIGIHSNIGATLSENRHVPVGVYRAQWDALKEGKRSGMRFAGNPGRQNPNRPMLGVELGEPGASGGVVLRGAMAGSPAEKAGLKAGDVVLTVNDKKTDSAEQLIEVVNGCRPGKTVKVVLTREGEHVEVEVKLARLRDLVEDGEEPEEEAEYMVPEADQEAAEKTMKELLEQALQNDGRLELTPDKLDEMGGMEGFAQLLQEMTESMDPAELQKLMQGQVMMAPDTFFESSMKALQPVVSKAANTTVDVLVDGKPAALGTVVSNQGWILTKDTETQKGRVTVQAGEKTGPAELVARFPKRDLALYKVTLDGLQPVRWVKAQKDMPLGSLLTAAGTDETPLGIGLVSVRTRPLAGVGFLGVQMAAGEDGVTVERVVDGGPAAVAGLKAGDVIISIEGKAVGEMHEFGQIIRGYRVGNEVTLKVRSGGEPRDVKVTLAERPSAPVTGQLEQMNRMSGPMSERQSGFPQALQHDIPLDPAQCGGPLLDLSGRCVGINVSRAGRVKTLAIPAGDVQSLLASVQPPATPEEQVPALTDPEREEIEKLLEEVRGTLEDLEKRLEKMEVR